MSAVTQAALPDHTTRWLRRLCLFVVTASVVEFVIATTGVQIRSLPHSTDFATYYLAGERARAGLSPYDRAAIAARGREIGFAHDQFPFLYPPPFALALGPFTHVSYPRARQLWMIGTTLAILGALAMTAALVFRQARAVGVADKRQVWIVLTAFVPAALNSTSVHNDIRAGSVGSWLWLFLATAAWALLDEPGRARRRGFAADLVAGLAYAGASLAKLTPLALVVWAALRGAARAASIAVAALAVSMLPALARWGIDIVPDYFRNVVMPSLRDDVAPPMNQSLDAFLSRLFVSSVHVQAPFDAPLLQRILSIGLVIGIAFVTVRAVAGSRRPALRPIEQATVLLATLALMKLTWVQTLTSMLWVWPVTMIVLVRAAENGARDAKRLGILACAGFFLSSAHIPVLWQGLRQGPWVIVTGAHLFGVLVLWGVCVALLRGSKAPAASQMDATTGVRVPEAVGTRL